MTDVQPPIDLDVPDGPAAAPRSRRQRGYWVGGAALLVAAVAIAIAGIGPTHAPQPPPPGPPPPSTGPLGWIEALVDGPARGALAGAPAFAQDLPAQIIALLHQTNYFPADLHGVNHTWSADQEVRLLFADDIGTQRIVMIAMRLPVAEAPTATPTDEFSNEDPPIAGNRTKVLWFVAPRGASVSSLLSYFSASPDGRVFVGSMPATPFILLQAAGTGFADGSSIGLAPGGCTVSTARPDDLDTFVAEPTGSYIVRTPAMNRAEYWRVTCGGTVREQWLAPGIFHAPEPGEIVAALAGAPGVSPADAQAADVQSAVGVALVEIDTRAAELTAAPRVVWAGTPQVDPALPQMARPYAVVVAAPAVRSGWFVGVWFGYLADGFPAGLAMALIHTDADPAGQAAVLAAPLQVMTSSEVLVLAPPQARRVRLQTSGGAVVWETPLTGVAAVLPLPTEPTDLRVQAFDETVTPVAAPAPVSAHQGAPDEIKDWSGAPTIAG